MSPTVSEFLRVQLDFTLPIFEVAMSRFGLGLCRAFANASGSSVTRFVKSRLGLGLCLSFALALFGCGKNDEPVRYRVSGSVSIGGKPVPFGEVLFTPDAAKKNSGPQGIAPIQNGRFDTMLGSGMGTGGGAVIIRVNGMSGPGGKTLCEYEMAVELPKGESTKDIDIPEKDAFNANPKGNQANPNPREI
jgi:hypothetical protein